MAASACELMPIAPAAAKLTTRQSRLTAAAAPSPFTRIILESQPMRFSVADEIRVHQHNACGIRDFDPKRNKKASHYVKRRMAPVTGDLPREGPRAYIPGTCRWRYS